MLGIVKTSIIKEEIIKSEISKLRSMLEKKATIEDNLVNLEAAKKETSRKSKFGDRKEMNESKNIFENKCLEKERKKLKCEIKYHDSRSQQKQEGVE